MINEEILLKNGFKKFNIEPNNYTYRLADIFYQYKVSSTKFINAYYYDKFKGEAIDYDFEFEIVEERENYWIKKLIFGLNKNISLEEIIKELCK